MGLFDDTKKMLSLRKEAKEIQKKLKNIHIEADANDATVVMNGEQSVISVQIKTEMDPKEKNKLEKSLVEAFNKGLKKSQSIAADNMKDIIGQLQGGSNA